MKTIAIIYLTLIIIFKIVEVFMFGKERAPYSPTGWVVGLVLNFPVYWVLWQIATN